MTGRVMKIQRFSTEDGPGIRTTVFLKGCPLRCLWCHNPESQSREPELFFDESRCTRCGRCAERCPNGCHTVSLEAHVYRRDLCTTCGKCLSPLCDALEYSGKEMTPEEVLAEVLKDRDFYESSGGGLTLSGGEPFYSGEFTRECLRLAKAAGLHTVVETCGAVSEGILRETADYVDLYLFDVKGTDRELHKRLTGVDPTVIRENLRLLDGMGKQTVLRCPIVPGLNDGESELFGIAELAESLSSVTAVEIEPYHTLGAPKYARLGREYAIPDVKAPGGETVAEWIRTVSSHTRVPVRRA